MKTNLFKVREKKEKKIVIEEEKYKNPLILFFIRHKSFILMSIGLLLLCIILISVGLAFSLFGSSSDFDITYIEGDEIIQPNPDVDDEDVMEELTGVGTEGVVVLVDRFMTSDGDIITYFSDGVSIVVEADGTIYKVYPTSSGEYGVDRNGNYLDDAVRGRVTSRSETLEGNTIITYYSDGSAQVEHNGVIIYVRDSDNIEREPNFSEVIPSGVSIESNNSNINGFSVIEFSDGTYLIISGDNKYIVNRNTEVSVSDNDVSYDRYNSFGTIDETQLDDGNTITYFEDGSAVIKDIDGKYIYVNKSGDIVVKDNKIYEIITNDRGDSTYSKRCPDGNVITYYDNGAAVITDVGGNKSYVEDSGDIIYNSSGNISSVLDDVSSVISSGKMETGESVTNFDNGKSEIINSDGSSYIIDSTDIKLVEDSDSNDEEEPNDDVGDDDPGNGNGTGGGTIDTSGIYVSDAENTYNYSMSIETTTFIIRNRDSATREFRIVIEEVDDYSRYNTSRLEPRFVKFQAVIGGEYVAPTSLDSNVWNDSDGSVNYVIYDGVVRARSTVSVNLSLYVDYAPLDNSYQDKGFIGTIKVYLIADDE